jgi:hypothetical protein
MRFVALLVALSLPAASHGKELSSADLDRLLAAEWKKAHVQPAPPVDDARFLRRIYLDLAGTIPPPEVVQAYLADDKPGKRERALTALLDGPAYADHFTNVWERLLIGRALRQPRADHVTFRAWLHDALARNDGWDAIARAVLASTGETDKNGATNFFLRYAQSPTDLTGKVARTFLGVQIQCAQCHDHPTEKWKRDDFRKLAAVFVRTGAQPVGEKEKGVPRAFLVRDFPISVAGLGMKMKDADLKAIEDARPAALDGTDFTGASNRRETFAQWLVKPTNAWFARAQVNRVWAMLVGRGFVEPIDDFRASNPVAAPAVLEALSNDFASHRYDLKRLIRLIAGTRAYQLAAAPVRRGNLADTERLFARYPLRPLGPEELYDSLMLSTHVEPLFQKFAGANFEKQKLQLRNLVAFLFDTDEEAEPNEFEGTVPQALLLINGPLINAGASALPTTALADILAMPVGDEAKIEQLYLRTLSRRPSAAETARWVAYLHAPREVFDVKKPGLRQYAGTPVTQAYEDLFWALLNSSEYEMRH